MTISVNDLVGAWRLVSVTEIFDDGERKPEFGPNADGYLSYSPNGIVSAVLGSMDRQPIGTGDPQSGTAEQIASLARTFLAYAGPFTIDPDTDTVTHHIDIALFADWQGGNQIRHFRAENDQLIAQGSPRTGDDGRTFHSELVWARVVAPSS
ncbi:lipocalin-like domain-containing protein [Microbacterium sp. 1P10UB]|uniref:lipocalin-like domain-containing protein n=1 Tax=unclassified Microbacterium TaxID=2609290 RepID=UPI0039A32EFA